MFSIHLLIMSTHSFLKEIFFFLPILKLEIKMVMKNNKDY